MSAGIKKAFFSMCVAVLSIATIVIGYDHVIKTSALEQTNRNELYAPSEYNVAVKNQAGYEKIYENRNFEYFYSNSKTILKIVNKKTGFIWSTGADTDRKATVENRCSSVSKYSDEYFGCAIDVGPLGNGSETDTNYATINGLMHFTYINDKSVESFNALSESVSSTLFGHKTYSNEWMFKVSYQKYNNDKLTFDFKFNIRFTFTEDGFDVNIYDEDIYGETFDRVEAIYLLPRLGQSGGKIIQCRIPEADEDGVGACVFKADASTIVNNPKTNLDGYIFVPDGSGALIRFDDVKYYSTGVDFYYDMYKDPFRETPNDLEFGGSNEIYEPDYVQSKHISMPVWGVAYGNNQDAFVAYVKSGSEYFGLNYSGRKADNEYASIQPRFERNRLYVYRFGDDSSGTNMSLKKDEIYRYDISVSYNFLHGDGSDGTAPANYVGMALKYRDYLQRNSLIRKNIELKIGPKVDFLISDVKEGIFGYSDVNVTNTKDIENMLTELHEDGIKDITSTLYGWQNGGMSKAKPWTIDYNDVAGGKQGFKNVAQLTKELGYDINFYQQYAMINEAQVKSFAAYCVKTMARDYGIYILADANKPITWWEYTNADVAGTWLNKQAKELAKLGDNVSITTGGISTNVVPDYSKKLSYSGAANSLYHSTKEASETLNSGLAGDTPNSFLWRNYDSFYNVSVYNSQLQCETDSVPFMEIVFGGLVNMYAEYANFSFYDKLAQLKMIDYNLNPSFILTAKENTDIMYTNARDWFTTSYDSYHSIINEICDTVIPSLELIKGKTIVNRQVYEFDNKELGVYINTYAEYNNGQKGNDEVVLAINYFNTDKTITYNGKTYTLPKESAIQLL